MDPSVPNSGLARLVRGLCSTEVAVLLFLAICIAAIPRTATDSLDIVFSPLVTILLGMMGVSTFACTVKRIKTLPRAVLVIHAGVILVLVGAVVSRFGYVATVNVYEGGSVSEVYRWDLHADTPLGFDLSIKRIGSEFYPTPVKVGVLRGEEKVGLFELSTGESFTIGGYQATVVELDPQRNRLRLVISHGGNEIGTVDTSDERQLSGGFPYTFRLVAFKTPKLKRSWVDLALSQGQQMLAEGASQVNGPMHYRGLDLFHVQTSRDQFGRAYAGIQLVRDPGRPVVFAGLAVVSLGALLTVARRLRESKSKASLTDLHGSHGKGR